MDEYTAFEDSKELRDMKIKPFARARYRRDEISHFFADRTMDVMTEERDLREQLRQFYSGAASAELHRVPFTYDQLGWMLHSLLWTIDPDMPEHDYISQVIACLPEGDGQVDFRDIRKIVGNIDPELYREVRSALRTP